MIKLTKFSGEELWVNPEIIKFLEEGGDTVVYLTTGDRLLVKESVPDVRQMFLQYKKDLFSGKTVAGTA